MTHFVECGRAPRIAEISAAFGVSPAEITRVLKELEDYHGVVLHPVSSEIWIMHPFSSAPTNFWIEASDGGWWGNCAWCSLGAAALLNRDLVITTSLGAEAHRVSIEIKDGELVETDKLIHFPIPMSKAWDNVTYTCSTMLVFDSEADVDAWCDRHAMERGDVQPIENVWEFSKVWYGNHFDPVWVKWSVGEAREIFERFNLVHPVWKMPPGDERF
jgi:hypothetical protein